MSYVILVLFYNDNNNNKYNFTWLILYIVMWEINVQYTKFTYIISLCYYYTYSNIISEL